MYRHNVKVFRVNAVVGAGYRVVMGDLVYQRVGVCFVRGRGLGAGRVFMAVFVLARVSKIAFGSMVWLSFRWLLKYLLHGAESFLRS